VILVPILIPIVQHVVQTLIAKRAEIAGIILDLERRVDCSYPLFS